MALANPERNGWSRIEVSQNAFMSMVYRNFHIHIFKKPATEDSEAQYYYSPALILDPQSVESSIHDLKKTIEVSFTVIMWDEHFQQAIQDALSKRLGKLVTRENMRPLPIEEIRIKSRLISKYYTIFNEWTSYAHQPDTFTFTLTCPNEEASSIICEYIKKSPKKFVADLTVYYSLQVQNTRRREITVRAEHIIGGDLFTQLQQKFPKKDDVFMKSDDAKKLTNEIAVKVMATEVTDDEFVNQDQALTISGLVEKALQMQTIMSESFTEEMWKSVFWHDNNARPDVVTQSLNDIYNKNDSTLQEGMRNELSSSSSMSNDNENSMASGFKIHNFFKSAFDRSSASGHKSSDSDSVKADGLFEEVLFKFDAGSNSNSESHNSNTNIGSEQRDSSNEGNFSSSESAKSANSLATMSKEDWNRLEKLLIEGKQVSQWNGEKFEAKPMSLTRVNLTAFKNTTNFYTTQIQVSKTTSELISRINVLPPEVVEPQTTERYNTAQVQVPETTSELPSRINVLPSEVVEPQTIERYIDVLIKDDEILQRTGEILKQHHQVLNAVLNELQPMMDEQSARIHEIRTLQDQMSAQDSLININANFAVQVDTPYCDRIAINNNVRSINCHRCNQTCEYPLSLVKLALMGIQASENCVCCPGRCHRGNHHSADGFRIEKGVRKETKINEHMKSAHDSAKSKKEQIGKDLAFSNEQLAKISQEIPNKTTENVIRLKEIALRIDVGSMPEYVDRLIESEKCDKLPGYAERIIKLESVRKRLY